MPLDDGSNPRAHELFIRRDNAGASMLNVDVDHGFDLSPRRDDVVSADIAVAVVRLIGFDNSLHELMPDDISRREVGKRHTVDVA